MDVRIIKNNCIFTVLIIELVFSPIADLFCYRVFFIIFVTMAHPTRIFKNPDELEIAWKLYKEDLIIQANEWLKVQYVGKDGERKTDSFKLPYTMEGFEVFCYNNYGCVNQYFDNKDKYYNDFVTICSHIKKEIRANQITGGLLGVYNPSITQRLNNLSENTKTEISGSLNVPNLPDIGNRKQI